jgi:hypothetical protein
MKGVMSVGVLEKGMIMNGDKDVNIVVMCEEKKKRNMINKVVENIKKKIKVVEKEEK